MPGKKFSKLGKYEMLHLRPPHLSLRLFSFGKAAILGALLAITPAGVKVNVFVDGLIVVVTNELPPGISTVVSWALH
jgi:hypothetical protein